MSINLDGIDIFNQDGLEFLEGIPDNSVDLILTDPPYITSRESGMNKWVDHVAEQDKAGAENIKTEEEWEKYSSSRDWDTFFSKDETLNKTLNRKFEGGAEHPKAAEYIKTYAKSAMEKYKEDYLKYGSIYGKKFAVTTDYGSWDSEFTMEALGMFMKHFYRILRDGGTCIIFFDIWKLSYLKEMMEGCLERPRAIPKTKKKDETEEEFQARVLEAENNPIIKYGFSQIRFIEWIKTNPQPINSSANYLTNCREIALTGVKKGSSTFNSKYDNGIYKYPLQGGKWRFHPTQKNLKLFEDLILKHSNEGDTVLDCFLGSGTTAVAAALRDRKFIGCEKSKEYFDKSLDRVNNQVLELKSKPEEDK